MVALGWAQVRFDQNTFFFIVVFGVPTLITSGLFLGSRFLFERWAKAHPEEVDTLLASPEAQRLLEQSDD